MGGQMSDRARARAVEPAPAGRAVAGPNNAHLTQLSARLQRKPNRTGMPDRLKAGVEALSGVSMDQVRVHYGSARPAQLQAHAYAQGSDIHLAPGQERALPHEAWHVVQQAQGRVRPTAHLAAGVAINDDAALEHEADMMGSRALSAAPHLSGEAATQRAAISSGAAPVQRLLNEDGYAVQITDLSNNQLRYLVDCLDNGEEPEGFTTEPGDLDRLIAEFQRRQEKIELDIEEDDLRSEIEDLDSDHEMDERDELEFHMTTVARFGAGLDKPSFKSGKDREIRQWPERSFQGTMGEYFANQTMSGMGLQPIALNGGDFGLNFPGGDHLFSGGGGGFMEQTKLHLSDHTASTNTYLGHVQKAPDYAIKAIKGFYKKRDVMQKLAQEPPFSTNNDFCEFVKALHKLEGTGDDDIDGSDAHDLLVKGTRFTIPADIYDKLGPIERQHFFRMDKTVAELSEMKSQFADDFIPSKKWGSGDHDEDFTL